MENAHADTLRGYLSLEKLWGTPGFAFHLQASSTALKVSLNVVLCRGIAPSLVVWCDIYAFERRFLSPHVGSRDGFMAFWDVRF